MTGRPDRAPSSPSCAQSPPTAHRVHHVDCALAGTRTRSPEKKVLFPDLVENPPYRVLNDFVLQRRDPQWPLSPIGFRYPDSPRRLRFIRPTMDSPVQVAYASLQVFSILSPCDAVHSRRRLFLQAAITIP